MNLRPEAAMHLHDFVLRRTREDLDAHPEHRVSNARVLRQLDLATGGALSTDFMHRIMVSYGLQESRSLAITGERGRSLMDFLRSADFARNGRVLVAFGYNQRGVLEPDGGGRASDLVEGPACFNPTTEFAACVFGSAGGDSLALYRCPRGETMRPMGVASRLNTGDPRVNPRLYRLRDAPLSRHVIWSEERTIHTIEPTGGVVRFDVECTVEGECEENAAWDQLPAWYRGHREIVAPTVYQGVRAVSHSGRYYARAIAADRLEIWDLAEPTEPRNIDLPGENIAALALRSNGLIVVIRDDGTLAWHGEDGWVDYPELRDVVAFAFVGPEEDAVAALSSGVVVTLDGSGWGLDTGLGAGIQRIVAGAHRSEFAVISKHGATAFADIRALGEADITRQISEATPPLRWASDPDDPRVKLVTNRDGSYVAIWFRAESRIRVFETVTFQEVARLDQPSLHVDPHRTTLEFAPDGKSIHYLSKSGVLMTWRFTRIGESELEPSHPPEGFEWRGLSQFGAFAFACADRIVDTRADASDPISGGLFAELKPVSPAEVRPSRPDRSAGGRARGWMVWSMADQRESGRIASLPTGGDDDEQRELYALSPCGATAFVASPTQSGFIEQGMLIASADGRLVHGSVGPGHFTSDGSFWVSADPVAPYPGAPRDATAWDCRVPRETSLEPEPLAVRKHRSLRLVPTSASNYSPCRLTIQDRIVARSGWPDSGLSMDERIA